MATFFPCGTCQTPFKTQTGKKNCQASHTAANARVQELQRELDAFNENEIEETKRILRTKISKELKGKGKKRVEMDCGELLFLKLFGGEPRLSKRRETYALNLYGEEITEVLDTCIGNNEPSWERRQSKDAVLHYIAKTEEDTIFPLKIKLNHYIVQDFNRNPPATSIFTLLVLTFTVQGVQQETQ